MQRTYELVNDSNPIHEWNLIQLEREHFGLPNGIERKISAMIEHLKDRKGDQEQRSELMNEVNALLSSGDLCFRFEDGRLSRGLIMNKWTNRHSPRKPVQFDLVKMKEHKNIDNRGLNHSFEIVPFLRAKG